MSMCLQMASGTSVSVLALAALVTFACGDSESLSPPSLMEAAKAREAAASQALETARGNPAQLSAFLARMPKGADLHSHLSGALLTESLIQWGTADKLCIDANYVASAGPCAAGTQPLSSATVGSDLYGKVLAAWSMEGGSQADVLTRHQRFFDAFGKFGVISGAHSVDGTEEVVSRAAAQGEVHMELMVGFSGSTIGRLADTKIKSADAWTDDFLGKARDTLVSAPEMQTAIQSTIDGLNNGWADLNARWRCGTDSADPACDVTVRYVIQGTRTQSREYVFGQWVYAFELAQADPRVVGINLVAAEEDALSLANYDEEMKAVRFLLQNNKTTPGRKPVHVSLHAGELIPEVLPMTPQGQAQLLFHIRRAVETAGAERIGHAVDVLGEMESAGMDPQALLKEMADKGVTVEACLTSNQMLLGKEGAAHPLSAYLAAGVPVALSTDDEGILRTDLNQEYVRAVQVQGLGYAQLKTSARNAVEKSFLQGQSLWADSRGFVPVAACAASDPVHAASPGDACQAYLKDNPRAAQQWKLEGKLAVFEQSQVAP